MLYSAAISIQHGNIYAVKAADGSLVWEKNLQALTGLIATISFTNGTVVSRSTPTIYSRSRCADHRDFYVDLPMWQSFLCGSVFTRRNLRHRRLLHVLRELRQAGYRDRGRFLANVYIIDVDVRRRRVPEALEAEVHGEQLQTPRGSTPTSPEFYSFALKKHHKWRAVVLLTACSLLGRPRTGPVYAIDAASGEILWSYETGLTEGVHT